MIDYALDQRRSWPPVPGRSGCAPTGPTSAGAAPSTELGDPGHHLRGRPRPAGARAGARRRPHAGRASSAPTASTSSSTRAGAIWDERAHIGDLDALRARSPGGRGRGTHRPRRPRRLRGPRVDRRATDPAGRPAVGSAPIGRPAGSPAHRRRPKGERTRACPSPPSRTTSSRTGPSRRRRSSRPGRSSPTARSTSEAEADYEAFWARQARELVTWFDDFDTVLDWQLPFAKWFVGGTLNVSYNCLDRHVEAGRGDKVAYHWEGEPGDTRTITYAELLDEVCRFANVLKGLGCRAGRPGRHLHADDPRAAGGHAGLHPHRCGPLGASSAASRPTRSSTGSTTPRPR